MHATQKGKERGTIGPGSLGNVVSKILVKAMSCGVFGSNFL